MYEKANCFCTSSLDSGVAGYAGPNTGAAIPEQQQQGYPQQQQGYPQQQQGYPQQQQGYPQQQQGYGDRRDGGQQGGYDRDRGGWDAPPRDFSELGRRAFHDGLESARMDMEAHRRMDARRSDFFKHPPVPGPARNEYRNSFQQGYNTAVRHMSERHDDHRDYPR